MMIDQGNKDKQEESKGNPKDKDLKISDEGLYRDHGKFDLIFVQVWVQTQEIIS